MSYIRCDFASDKIKMMTSLIALLPEKTDLSEVPVIYLLHGLTDNCSGWTRFSAIERYAREKSCAVIMPEVQRSFYADMTMGVNYFSYILEELPEFCHRTFGLSLKREKNYIMGLSMGGYGALKCALSAMDRFIGCASFSAVADMEEWIKIAPQCEKEELKAIFNQQLQVPDSCNLFKLAEKEEPSASPHIFMTCGEQDPLYSANTRFYKYLKENGFPVTFEHWEGAHSWDFWDRSVRLALNSLLPQQ